MDMDREEFLKKAIKGTQERVRDYMNFSHKVKDEKLQNCIKDFAETEGRHAQELQGFLDELS